MQNGKLYPAIRHGKANKSGEFDKVSYHIPYHNYNFTHYVF